MSSAFGFSHSKRESPAFRTRERQRDVSSAAFASGAFSSRPRPAGGAGGGGSSFGSSFGPSFGSSSRAAKEEPVVVATSYTDFPTLKKAAAAPLPSKPVMNFKAVAAAVASKPAPIPMASVAKKETRRPYYEDEDAYDYDEEVELEITDEDGGLNSRRAGDKSNW